MQVVLVQLVSSLQLEDGAWGKCFAFEESAESHFVVVGIAGM